MELGLERYVEAFEANDVDAGVLRTLNADDLKELGVTSLGHRKKLLEAIAALAQQPSAVPKAAADSATSAQRHEAERRQLTVLFCDLVGSTALAARLDPEDMGRVIRAYQRCCTAVVERWDGHVAKYMGDGVLAYFGWPQAHEDEAERSVRAGLELVQAVSALDVPGLALGGGRDKGQLEARVGIATGLVMVGELTGEGAAQEQTVVGETPNLAARLQTLAEPGTVVISQATRRLVGGLFELADLGPRRLKGFVQPIAAWRVEGEGRAEGRFEALHGEHLTPLVGREHELGILLERWAWAKDGDGQVVLLLGEPGIGKSRVVRTLRERLGNEPYTPLSHYGSPHHTNSALHPVIGLLERAARLDRDEPAEAQLVKLEAVLGRSSDRLDEAVPLLAALLGVPTGARYPALTLTPEVQKRRTLQVLVDQLAGLAAQQPVLALYEDVHWIDPSTLELLGLVIERSQRLPVLVLITFRPEFQPPWTDQTHVTTVTLSRLGRRQGADLVARVTGDKPLPAEIVEQIVTRTDGVPLFVEELTKTVLESGLLIDTGDRYELSGPLPPLAIPTTLHDSLMARLDRLASVKEVAQIGAIIGRHFSHDLLAAVSPLSEDDLGCALDQLVASELVFRHGSAPEATYSFKHALVQDAAYQSLLKTRRKQLHAKIAATLEQRFAQLAETQPEVLARHFSEAGLVEKAVDYWIKAGRGAAARSANFEAVTQLEHGLSLLSELPHDRERHRRELALLLTAGGPLIATRGYAAAETVRAYSRARQLCEELDEQTQLLPALYMEFAARYMRAEHAELRDLLARFARLVEVDAGCGLDLVVDRMLALVHLHGGEPTEARRLLENIVARYRPELHADLALRFGQDPCVTAQCYLTCALIALGFPDQAERVALTARTAAAELPHTHTQGLATFWSGSFSNLLLRRGATAETQARDAIVFCTENRMALWLGYAQTCLGWARLEQGDAEGGREGIGEGITALRRTGTARHMPLFLCQLARAEAESLRPEQALETMADAVAAMDESGDLLWASELHRRHAEILLLVSEGDRRLAETHLRQAIEIARQQAARLFELRAAVSLARLWSDQSKQAEACNLLAPIYDWFTEGFDTADLKEAKALLDELS
jgi:class 3 adenylate cyclase/predicted ATPase